MGKAQDFLEGIAEFGEGFASGYSTMEPIRRDMEIKQELGLRKLELKNKRKDEEEKNRVAMAKEKADFYTKLRDEIRKQKEDQDKKFDKVQQDKQEEESAKISRSTFISGLRESIETSGAPREKKLAALSALTMNEGSDKKTGAIVDQIHKILFTPDKVPSGTASKPNKMSVGQTAAAAKGVVDSDLQGKYPGLKGAMETLSTAKAAGYDPNAPDSVLSSFGDAGLPDRLRSAKQLAQSADSSLGMARPLREATIADSINTTGLKNFLQNRGQGQMAPIGGGATPAPTAAPAGFTPGQEWDGGGEAQAEDPTEAIISELADIFSEGEFTIDDIDEMIAIAQTKPKYQAMQIDWERVKQALTPAE